MLLRRLVRNLLENARVHAGGATGVRIESDAQHARIVIEDAGEGIRAHRSRQIFEPFYRASTATRSSGAGLGLAIVRQIARAHGGTVEYAAARGRRQPLHGDAAALTSMTYEYRGADQRDSGLIVDIELARNRVTTAKAERNNQTPAGRGTGATSNVDTKSVSQPLNGELNVGP